MRALLLALAACGAEWPERTTGRYGIAYDPVLVADVGLGQLDHGVDLLVEQLGNGAALRLSGRNITVTVEPEVWEGDRRFHGLAYPHPLGGHIRVAWQPGECVADSALLWELAQLVFHDRYYSRPEWALVTAAMADWRLEACP
jgi:hypothetical protein